MKCFSLYFEGVLLDEDTGYDIHDFIMKCLSKMPEVVEVDSSEVKEWEEDG